MVGGRAGAISHETVKWSPSKLVKWSPSLQSPYHHSLGTLCGAGLLGATGRFGCFRFRSNTRLLLYTWRKSASGPPARDPLPRHAASRNGAVFMYIFQVLTVCCSQCFAVCVCVCVCVCVRARAGACSSVGCHRRYSEENSQGSSGPSVITSMQRMRVLTCLKFALTHFGGE